MYTALNAASETIRLFLSNSLAADTELAGFFDREVGGTFEVVLCTPQELPSCAAHGVTVWLYQVARDEQRLNAPPQRIDDRHLARRPLPLRLHYLVTPMVRLDEDGASGSTFEQLVLGKILQILHDYPILRGVDLSGGFGSQQLELNVRLEPLELDQITRIWEALGTPYQLSVSYEVSLVDIESAREPEAITPVDVVLPELGLILGEHPREEGEPCTA